MNKWLIIFLIATSSLQAYAFEDYIVSTKGKLTDIRIQDNKILDVSPITTIMNSKNTLLFHPLQTGKTRVSVLKNNKDRYYFNVEIEENETKIESQGDFEILSIDNPPEGYVLDFPPIKTSKEEG